NHSDDCLQTNKLRLDINNISTKPPDFCGFQQAIAQITLNILNPLIWPAPCYAVANHCISEFQSHEQILSPIALPCALSRNALAFCVDGYVICRRKFKYGLETVAAWPGDSRC